MHTSYCLKKNCNAEQLWHFLSIKLYDIKRYYKTLLMTRVNDLFQFIGLH